MLAATVALFTGCAGGPPAAGPAGLPAARLPSAPPSATTVALDAFEQKQRAAALAAAAQGRWSDASYAWDLVLTLHPKDAQAAAQRARADAAAQAAVAERLPRARLAQQRGDAEGASRLWLEVLALAPQNAEAADALRAIEKARAERNAVVFASRTRPAPRPLAPDSSVNAGTRNALEHASLLAGQGETAAAIAMLQPLVAARPAEPGLRAMLADLYLRQAEQLASSDARAAIGLLERCLALHPEASLAALARQRLRELRSLSGPSSSAR
jgi:hypothetical protein